ncbi:MAG: DMT family transporter [Actinomycetota bacterium]
MTRLIGLAGIVLISFSAIFVRLADVSPTTAAFYRATYALPVLFIAARFMRDDRTRRERLLALGAGVLFAADLTLWHTSIEYIGAGLSTVVANSQVLWVGLLAWMLLGEKPRKAAFVVVPIALVGIALIGGLGRDDAYGENPMLGVIFALLAGISYSLFLLVYRASNKRMGPPAGPLLDTTAGGALTMLLISRFDGDFSFAFSWPSHGWLIALGVVIQSFGWLLISVVLPRLPALDTSMMLLLQPASTVLWAQIIFTETLSSVQWIGMIIVFVAIIGAALASATGMRKAALAAPEP